MKSLSNGAVCLPKLMSLGLMNLVLANVDSKKFRRNCKIMFEFAGVKRTRDLAGLRRDLIFLSSST